MNTLENILKSIEVLQPTADMDPMIGPYETAVGRKGMQRQAVERISDLRLEYKSVLSQTGLFMVVTGPQRQAFADLAESDTFGCFSVDADDFYKSLIAKINPISFGRERTSHLFTVASNALYDRAMELGIGSYNAIQYSNEFSAYVNNPEEFLPILKKAINLQVGSEIVGMHTIDILLDRAIAKKHSTSVTPIILNCPDDMLAVDLVANLPSLYKNVFLVSAGKPSKTLAGNKNLLQVKTVSEESVGEALKTIRSNMKK